MKFIIECEANDKIKVYRAVMKLANELKLQIKKIKWGDKTWTIKEGDDIKFFMHDKTSNIINTK